MKLLNRNAIVACIAAALPGLPCAAQSAQTLRVVHVVTNTRQTPETKIETEINAKTEAAIAEAVRKAGDAEPALRAAQETLQKALQGQVYQNFAGAYTPEMAK